jgi:GWxTD domain-containing protein
MASSLSGCGPLQLGTRAAGPEPQPNRSAERPAPAEAIDAVSFYRSRGLVASGPPLPFTGSVRFLATASGDSTYAIISIALGASSLTFRREGDEFRADYRVSLTLRRDAEVVARAEATEPVRIATLRETLRSDESVLFQQIITAPPGPHSLTVEVRDIASGRAMSHNLAVQVPAFDRGGIAPPSPVYESVPRAALAAVPRVVMNPRGSAIVGSDSVFNVYVEAYREDATRPVVLALRVDDELVWTDTVMPVAAAELATALVRVPIAGVAVGTADILAWPVGGQDTARTPAFVGFSDDLPATTYSDMLDYLEYFTSESRLRALRRALPRERGSAWRELMISTDPQPATSANEALRAYFARMLQANGTYAEGSVPGWRTDRGMTLLVLGEPDQVLDQFSGDATLRGRVQQWDYRALNLTLVFEDAMGLNRWRLTRASEAALAAERERRQGRQ